MVGEFGGDCALPLLPAGKILFAGLPFGAVVVDALAPAVGNGVITLNNSSAEGVLVIRDGLVSEMVWVAGGVRTTGEHALALIRADATMVSASQFTDEAMGLVEPLIRAEPQYADLRLEWVVWPKLLNDLRERDQTFVVEVTSPEGHGVTVIQGGRQIATFGESGAALGDADLLNDLAAGAVGTVRVLIDRGEASPREAQPSLFVAPGEEPQMGHGVGPSAIRDRESLTGQHGGPTTAQSGERHAIRREEPHTADGDDPKLSRREEPQARQILALNPPRPVAHDADDPNATLSAMFGPRPDAVEWHAVAIERPTQGATTSVESVLPQLLSLVQNRLQRSSGSVEEVVDNAASDHQSVAWLADRVRVMTVRGFLRTTFEQLAEDMLAVAAREAD